VGSALFERALAVLNAQGIQTVKLEVRPTNEAALGIYRRYGFEQLRTIPRYYDDGEDALIFVRAFDDR